MIKPLIYIILWLMSFMACTQNPEKMVGPTIGTLNITSDESMKYIVEQEENIFERTYAYAKLNITYKPELDMFRDFMADSTRAIMTTRPLTSEEYEFFIKKDMYPMQYAFATGALAFVTNKNEKDTTYTYEEVLTMFRDGSKGKLFVIENAKSGISHEILDLIDTASLPEHFYALNSKQEVMDYVLTHDDAIGIMDWSDFSDSDNAGANEMLKSINLISFSRPVDSTQFGFLKPYQYNLQDDKYPFTRDLYFISNTGMNDVGTGFASFISGEIGQKIILKAGLLPKFQHERVLEMRYTSDIKVIK